MWFGVEKYRTHCMHRRAYKLRQGLMTRIKKAQLEYKIMIGKVPHVDIKFPHHMTVVTQNHTDPFIVL